MAKVRRINVSQIEGGYSNDSDKRPYGEICFYEDALGGGLDLVIHDGINSTNLNKVLGKGKLYGHNNDSGDGNGYDTIKLIPDIGLYNTGSHQYLVVDPTASNHLHLRAGGDQDNSSADLFLGGENTNVKVSDQDDSVSVNVTGSGSNHEWRFGNDGTLLIPNGSSIQTGYGGVTIKSDTGTINPNPGDLLSGNLYVSSGQISISYAQESSIGGPESRYQWDFNSTSGLLQLPGSGGIEFPDQTIQTTAWTGGRVVTEPSSSLGATGDLQGDIAFNSSYLYYCTENYGGTQYQVVNGLSSPANGVDSGYLVYNNYQLPQVGWQVNYDGNSAIIDQVNSSSPDWYVVFVSTPLLIPGDATFSWGPIPSTNIWKRIEWSIDTW